MAASWDRDAGARADWPDAGGSVENARVWMVERCAKVDGAFYIITQQCTRHNSCSSSMLL